MDSQIVSIDDLKEYDTNLKNLLSNKNILVNSDSEKTSLKVSIVSSFPASLDANTIYIIPNGSIINVSTIPKGNIKIGSETISNIYIGSTKVW